jgi:hypothetical protein
MSALSALRRSKASNACFVCVSRPIFITFLLRHLELKPPGHAKLEFTIHQDQVFPKSTLIPAAQIMALEFECTGKP